MHQILVVFFQQFFGSLLGFHGDELVALGFESADNVANESALDAIGFDLQQLLGGMKMLSVREKGNIYRWKFNGQRRVCTIM